MLNTKLVFKYRKIEWMQLQHMCKYMPNGITSIANWIKQKFRWGFINNAKAIYVHIVHGKMYGLGILIFIIIGYSKCT